MRSTIPAEQTMHDSSAKAHLRARFWRCVQRVVVTVESVSEVCRLAACGEIEWELGGTRTDTAAPTHLSSASPTQHLVSYPVVVGNFVSQVLPQSSSVRVQAPITSMPSAASSTHTEKGSSPFGPPQFPWPT